MLFIPKFKKRGKYNLVKQVKPKSINYRFKWKANEYHKIITNNKDAIKHILKKELTDLFDLDIKRRLIKTFPKCFLCNKDIKPSFKGVIRCKYCYNYGCIFHFCTGDECIKCFYKYNDKKNIQKYKKQYKNDYITKSYVKDHSEKTILLVYDKYLGKHIWLTNIPDTLRAKFVKNNQAIINNADLQVETKCYKTVKKSETQVKNYENMPRNGLFKKLCALYSKKLETLAEEDADVYLPGKIDDVEYETKNTAKKVYVLKKKIKMVNAKQNLGLSSAIDCVHPSVIERGKQWTKYFRHCIIRDGLWSYAGEKSYRPNKGWLKNHEQCIEGYYSYQADGKIMVCNLLNEAGKIRYRQSQKLNINWLFNAYDQGDLRITTHSHPSKGGIDASRFPHLNVFQSELFQIASRLLNVHKSTNIDYSKDFNGIQVNNTSYHSKASTYSPKWHVDANTLWNYGQVEGILTIHLSGYNYFLTNSCVNDNLKKSFIEKNAKVFAKNIWKWGVMKQPGSSYFVTGLSSRWLQHCVLTGKAVSLCKSEYNKVIEKELGQKYAKIWKVKASKKELSETPTESWVFRSHGK